MAFGDADDPTVPTGRAGVDPLLAYPKESTGLTGQIERPGDQTPWWFVPGLCAVALFFIGLLATINQDRESDRIAAAEQVVVIDEAPAPSPAPDTATSPAPESTVDPQLATLPDPGTVRVDGAAFPIESRCEVHAPFAPEDTSVQVSSYFYFDDDGERGLIDRVFDGETETAQLLDEASFVSLQDIGDTGAFSATFAGPDGAEFDVVVNPASDGQEQCGDRLVTNAPGQFSEPHTRIIMDVCIDRTTDSFASIVGLTSEGGHFEILQAGGELGEIVFAERGVEIKRTTAPASIIRTGDITSASGVVSEGVDDLDISIDIGTEITEADARTCVASDRL